MLHGMSSREPAGFIAALAIAALPAAARAGNGVHPRTPVVWPDDTACLTVVDRSKGATLLLTYTIPYEDTAVTVDEVDDSRNHQFIAFCRDHSRQEPPPSWLTWKDVDAAVSVGLLDAMDVTDEDVFETSMEWKDCWYPITTPEERRPITFAEAMKPVDWDTTELPAGAYSVQGYTWEPIFNIFNQRPGIVHVVDSPDLALVGPAAAVTTQLDFTFAEDNFVIEGCFRAMPGSTMSGYWAQTNSPDLDWIRFADTVALEGETFVLPFNIPPAAVGETVALRVDITDPMQRTYSAHGVQLLTILPGSGGASTDCDEASFIAEPCATEGIDTTAPPTSTFHGTDGSSDSSTSTPIAPLQGDPVGCTCDATGAPAAAWAWLFVLGTRRRRSGSIGRSSSAQTQAPPPMALSHAPGSASPNSQ